MQYYVKRFGLILAACYLGCGNVIAAELKKDIAKCAQISGDLERLECFDSVSRSQGLAKPTVAKSSIAGKGKWKVQVESNPIDDSKTVVLTLAAKAAKSRWGQPVTLLIRCKSNETDFYIAWNDYLGSEANVLTRLGQEQASTEEWSLSTDSKATFYPGNPVPYIKKMMVNDSFVAQVTPYNESPVTATFDIKGLARAIEPLIQTCHWDQQENITQTQP